MKTMPKIDFSKIKSTEAKEIASMIVKSDGTLYASKPSKANGKGKFMWRMVALMCSPHGRHQCMPVTATFDLQDYFEDQGYSDYQAYDKVKAYIANNKTTIAELQDAFGYPTGSLPHLMTGSLPHLMI